MIKKYLSLFLLLGIFACSDTPEMRDGLVYTPNTNLKLSPKAPPTGKAAYDKVLLGGCNYLDRELKLDIRNITLGTKMPGNEHQPSKSHKKGNYAHVVLNDTLHLTYNYRNIPTYIPDGAYRLYAFAVRSNHESIKTPEGFMSRDIVIKGGRMVRSMQNEEAAIVYGVPRGVYAGQDTEKVLLDFYLPNINILPKANYVKVKIDNQAFTIDQWQAHYIEGLGLGKHKVELTLYNSSGNKTYGPVRGEFVCKS